ncbi:hypothetical protein [Bergeriella denitrificans]|uniref:Uncharacterized protein n=1 Tax=Bergeriella denitrificans TaxID=494 RepID=A0A378UF86_BERDE|nr:hypothetical protein [Bergeriella denitrificans]STZ75359.1 Uncharacterised protein [Bergeriella denitrificans]
MNTRIHLSITALLLAVYWFFMFHIALYAPADIATFIFIEGGTVESVSPYLWFALAALCLFGRLKMPTRLATAAAAVLLGLREMDLHKSFFQEAAFRTHFLRSNFYLSDIVPLSHKIIGGLLVITLAVLVLYLLKTFVASWRQKDSPRLIHFYTLLAVALLAAAKVADRANMYMEEYFHRPLEAHTNLIVQAFEESAEMAAPVLLCTALIFYGFFRRPNNSAKQNKMLNIIKKQNLKSKK